MKKQSQTIPLHLLSKSQGEQNNTMKKQTAVEWLVDELRNQIAQGTLDAIAISELKMKAKAMEREQINTAFNNGVGHVFYPKGNPLRYYEQTYK